MGSVKCLHTGHGNEDAQYTMCDTVLNTTLKEKDLGLTISADMEVSEQCRIAAAKGLPNIGIVYCVRHTILKLFFLQMYIMFCCVPV